ncbi:hypothetical protein DBY21_00920 [Candidatus Gastranaerophilales bacterium]|nr:MAG: hypothetical protein DBY21_00920 [Candidatus Gastranaerophilales bacterium]
MYYQNIKKKIILILVSFFLSTQPTIAEEINFNDFLATALYNSYNLKISKIEHEISNKGINEAQSGYYPTLSAFATTERYNDLTNGTAQITAVGNEILLNRSYYQDMAALGLSYNVFDFGMRRKQLDIAKADEKQKELLFRKSTRDLKLDGVDIYGEALNLYKISKIKTETLSLQNELIDINKRLRSAGELSDIDLVESEIEASETKTELDEIKNNLAKKLTEVSYYTNKNYDLNNLVLQDFPENVDSAVVSDGLIKLSAEMLAFVPEESFEAKAADLEILKKKKEYEIQKMTNYPKIRFDTRYNFYGSDPGNFFNGIGDISQRSLTIRLSASMVLFDGFKNTSTISKKKLEMEKAKVDKERQLAELKKKYKQIQLDSKNALVQTENNAATLALVNKNLENLRRLNTNGIVARSECIKKQIELLKKKQELEQNQIKIFVSQYKLRVLNTAQTEL